MMGCYFADFAVADHQLPFVMALACVERFPSMCPVPLRPRGAC